MNANPLAFNMISSDIKTNTILRRVYTPINPMENKIAASMSPCSIGIDSIFFLLSTLLYLVFAKWYAATNPAKSKIDASSTASTYGPNKSALTCMTPT